MLPTSGVPTPAHWRGVWRALGAAVDDALYPELLSRYRAPERHYHTTQHLEEMFALWPLVEPLTHHAAEVEAAIWFHDAVFDATRSDNESRSAEWARAALLAGGAKEAVAARVHGLVMATTHEGQPEGADAQALVDLDLSILGTDPVRFDQYEHQVRAEYAMVPVTDFRARRREILERFLARPRIFGTAPIFALCESQARENLSRSVARLSA
ncbi:MAG: HD domain-containing protein [Gemmatimonadaceae bacterium]